MGEGRRYLGVEVLARAQAVDNAQEVTSELTLQASGPNPTTTDRPSYTTPPDLTGHGRLNVRN